MPTQHLIKACVVELLVAVAAIVTFFFGVARAPVVPLYLLCCVASGLLAGIATWFLVNRMFSISKQLRTTGYFLERFFTLLFLTLALCIIFPRQFLFFLVAQQKRFETGLMLQGYGVALAACCLVLFCFSLFAYLRDAARAEEV